MIIGLAIFALLVVVITSFLYLLRLQSIAISVNGAAVTKNVYTATYNRNVAFFEKSKQTIDPETVKSDSITYLIDKQLLLNYAAENNIIVGNEAINTYYQSRVDNYGSEDKLLAYLQDTYGIDKAAYLETLSYDILKEEVQKSLGSDTPLGTWLDQQRANASIKVYIK